MEEGASTLTQQLVKNYYLTPERTMRRKVVEAFMAIILDAKYSKKEILEALRAVGSKGGKAGTGKSKVRGDSSYYRRLRKMGVRKQKGKS